MKKLTVYSSTENGNFNHFDLSEIGLSKGDIYYSGTAEIPEPSDFFEIDIFLNDLSNNAYVEYDEFAEDWLNHINDSEKQKLDKYIKKWLNKNAPVNFWNVSNVKKHVF